MDWVVPVLFADGFPIFSWGVCFPLILLLTSSFCVALLVSHGDFVVSILVGRSFLQIDSLQFVGRVWLLQCILGPLCPAYFFADRGLFIFVSSSCACGQGESSGSSSSSSDSSDADDEKKAPVQRFEELQPGPGGEILEVQGATYLVVRETFSGLYGRLRIA